MDLLQRRSEAEALERTCRLLRHDVAVSHVESLARLRERCRFIASIDEHHDEQRRKGIPLCVHIAAHGNADGLGIGPEVITWAQLADAILPLGRLENYSASLIVVLSACDAGQQQLTSELAKRRKKDKSLRLPAYVFVTCDRRLAWTSSVAAWTVFYHLILKKAKLDQPSTVKEVLATVRAAGGALLRYYRWDDGKHKYLKHEPQAAGSSGA